MIDTDYRIEALNLLLNEDCLSGGYHPLIVYKEKLITELKKRGCSTKNDIAKLSDDDLISIGLENYEMVGLFRKFLTMYDPKLQKFKEITKVTTDTDEQKVFKELYHLPGVKYTRAVLYYRAGYRTLEDFIETTVDQVLSRTAMAIKEYEMSCIVPLPKEVRTHIAVAKAFLYGNQLKSI